MITTKNAIYSKMFEIRDCPSLASEYSFFLVYIIPHPLMALCPILLLFIEVFELFRIKLSCSSPPLRIRFSLPPSSCYHSEFFVLL